MECKYADPASASTLPGSVIYMYCAPFPNRAANVALANDVQSLELKIQALGRQSHQQSCWSDAQSDGADAQAEFDLENWL